MFRPTIRLLHHHNYLLTLSPAPLLPSGIYLLPFPFLLPSMFARAQSNSARCARSIYDQESIVSIQPMRAVISGTYGHLRRQSILMELEQILRSKQLPSSLNITLYTLKISTKVDGHVSLRQGRMTSTEPCLMTRFISNLHHLLLVDLSSIDELFYRART